MSKLHIPSSALTNASSTLDSSKPAIMLNLIRFHAIPQYPADTSGNLDTSTGVSGREAYMTRYLPVWQSVVDRYGGAKVRFFAGKGLELVSVVAGTDQGSEESWDAVALIEYGGFAAFEGMVGDAEYLARGEPHRLATIRDWRLVACEEMSVVV